LTVTYQADFVRKKVFFKEYFTANSHMKGRHHVIMY
jgi:hypothetical protein